MCDYYNQEFELSLHSTQDDGQLTQELFTKEYPAAQVRQVLPVWQFMQFDEHKFSALLTNEGLKQKYY